MKNSRGVEGKKEERAHQFGINWSTPELAFFCSV